MLPGFQTALPMSRDSRDSEPCAQQLVSMCTGGLAPKPEPGKASGAYRVDGNTESMRNFSRVGVETGGSQVPID